MGTQAEQVTCPGSHCHHPRADTGHAGSGIGSLSWSQVEVTLEEPAMEKGLSRLVSVTGEPEKEGAGKRWVNGGRGRTGHRAVRCRGSWLHTSRFRSMVAPTDGETEDEFRVSIMDLRSQSDGHARVQWLEMYRSVGYADGRAHRWGGGAGEVCSCKNHSGKQTRNALGRQAEG